jgi:hypothetical protein
VCGDYLYECVAWAGDQAAPVSVCEREGYFPNRGFAGMQQLGLLGRLRGVSGSSGGAVYALLAALDFSIAGEWGCSRTRERYRRNSCPEEG